MSNLFFISDTHFGHKKMLNFTDAAGKLIRGQFSSVEEMDQYMIDQWNSAVRKKDLVWHLGDVAWSAESLRKIGSLNGRKKLILGNHDKGPMTEYLKYFDEIFGAYKQTFQSNDHLNVRGLLTHYPVYETEFKYGVAFNIHGHVHTNTIPDQRYYNVSVEPNNYKPVPFEKLADYVRKVKADDLLK